MDNESKKKGNIGLIIIIVILSLLVVGLGYYFVSHEFLNSSSNVEKTDNGKKNDTKKDELEEDEIGYKFDADKIINKDTTYVYSLSENIDNLIPYRKKSNECYFFYGNSNATLTGDFTTIVSAQVFKGGPGISNSFVFLIDKNGKLNYANLDSTEKIVTGTITQIKDVVKLYVVDLTSDRPSSPNGLTVVAQTKDGSLYDLYEYVMK